MPQVKYEPPYEVKEIPHVHNHLGMFRYAVIHNSYRHDEPLILALCHTETEATRIAEAMTNDDIGREILGNKPDYLVNAIKEAVEKYLSGLKPVDIEYRIPSSGTIAIQIDLTQRRLDLPKMDVYTFTDPQGVVKALLPHIEQYLKSPYMSEFIEKLGRKQTGSRGFITLMIDLTTIWTGEPGGIKGSISEIPE